MDYKIRFVNYPRHWQTHRDEFMAVIEDRLSRGELIIRQDVLDFEKNISELTGAKFAKGLNSGFDALHLSLKALNIGPGDEVVTVAHTFMATISAIVLVGAKPVLIDIGKDWNMDMSLLETAITPKTKVVIPVHLNGRMCDMDTLGQIIKRFEEKGQRIHVIEDACQALGAKFNGKGAGSFGATGCFSHYPAKILGCFGEGGALTTNDGGLDEKILLLRYHGVMRDPARTPKMFGYNAVLDNIQAAILNVKLAHFDEAVTRRAEIAKKYQAELSGIKDLKLPHFEDSRYLDAYWNYVVQTTKRDELKQHLESQGVETIISWPKPIYSYDFYKKSFPVDPLPVTEKVCREVISLPIYPELTDEEVNFVIQAVKDFYTK
ncbi:MAG: DegT/DnrJ/EryC1/StrS family aminotransferase [Candidatus Colwellbacteria bacterium]|nr:DegT/DnrJ/EryC1/StrS family aminotransferase [Candidatus Colwellbacteria bacterium]